MTSQLRERAAEANNGNGHSTEVATFAGEPAPSIALFIQSMQPELARALPKGLDASRMARLALTAIRKDPALGQCTPQSFAGALLTASALGLEVGTTGEAYLVAYKRECTLIVGYQGYCKLYWNSPLAKHVDAHAVYANDEFDYAYGLGQFLRHKPAKGNRGDVVCYYACAELTTGGSAFVVLSPDEVKDLRQGKVGPDPRFKGGDPMHWMERKTALRQLFKMLPRSTELNRAMDADEKGGTTLYAERVEDKAPAISTPTMQQLPAGSSEAVDPPQEWDGDEPPMRDDQRRAMFGNFAKLHITDDEDGKFQRDYISDAIGRQVTSRGELTMVEADQLLACQQRDLT